jgi:hypothetical protein
MIIIYRGGTQLKDITISVTSEAFWFSKQNKEWTS